MTEITVIVFGVIITLLIILIVLLVKNILDKKDNESEYARAMNDKIIALTKDMNDRVMVFFDKAFEHYKTEAEPPPGGPDKILLEEKKDEGKEINIV